MGRTSISITAFSPLFFRYSSLTCLANFSVFLTPMLQYLLISLARVLYPGSLLHSSPFPRSFPLSQADRHYSYIPLETFCGCTPCSGIDTAVFLYCFSHITTLLCSRNMDTPLLSLPSLFPSAFFPHFTSYLSPVSTAI